MEETPELEERVTALEARVGSVETDTATAVSDAAAARHLTAARDRDLADLTVHVDANRTVINAVGEQLSASITELRNHVDQNFVGVRGQLDAVAAGQQTLVDMLTLLVDDRRPEA